MSWCQLLSDGLGVGAPRGLRGTGCLAGDIRQSETEISFLALTHLATKLFSIMSTYPKASDSEISLSAEEEVKSVGILNASEEKGQFLVPYIWREVLFFE